MVELGNGFLCSRSYLDAVAVSGTGMKSEYVENCGIAENMRHRPFVYDMTMACALNLPLTKAL